MVASLIVDRHRILPRARFDLTWVESGAVHLDSEGKLVIDLWTNQERTAAQQGRDAPDGYTGWQIYTDGTGGTKECPNAGWGFVCVDADDIEQDTGCGGVSLDPNLETWDGAEVGTNNTAELTAVIRGLEWAEASHIREVCMRFDSQYAACMTRGKWKPTKNKRLVQYAVDTLRRVETSVVVHWKWVKGHSGEKWNERADKLADEGAAQSQPTTTDGVTAQASASHESPQRSPACRQGKVRWVQRQPTEASRVLISRTAHGTLNTHAHHKKDLTSDEVGALCSLSHGRMLAEKTAGEITGEHYTQAARKLHQARQNMLKSAYQKKERQGRKTPKYTRELDCDIDVSTLKRLADEDGDCLWGGKHTQRTYRDTIDALLKSTRTDLNTGQCTLRLQYSYGKLGRDLFEAGHITASREYSQGDDPFKLPKRLQQAALGKISVAYDDNAAYPRAKMALIPEGSRLGYAFLEHRHSVFEQYGNYLFHEITDAEEIHRRMKMITNGYDMGSSLDAWARKFSNPHKRSVKDMVATVPHNGGTLRFNLAAYHQAQKEGAKWMETKSQSMVEHIRAHTGAGSMAREKASQTAQSYILQEAEAVSRFAKISRCESLGLRVTNLQHDGITTTLHPSLSHEQVAAHLSRAATAGSGYRVVVVGDTDAPEVVN
jgi:ribonuclease HI